MIAQGQADGIADQQKITHPLLRRRLAMPVGGQQQDSAHKKSVQPVDLGDDRLLPVLEGAGHQDAGSQGGGIGGQGQAGSAG